MLVYNYDESQMLGVTLHLRSTEFSKMDKIVDPVRHIEYERPFPSGSYSVIIRLLMLCP